MPNDTDERRPYVKTEIRVQFEEPPAPRRGRGSSRLLFDALMSLKDNPDRWASIAVCNGNSGASALKSAITGGKKNIPDGKYEYRAAGATPEDGRSTLYARYLDEEEV
jgi:hypothetical protein